jgi:hypothetical protein
MSSRQGEHGTTPNPYVLHKTYHPRIEPYVHQVKVPPRHLTGKLAELSTGRIRHSRTHGSEAEATRGA